MSTANYAGVRRSAALRYTDGSARRTAATTAHQDIINHPRLQFRLHKNWAQRPERYTRDEDQQRLAESAMHLLESRRPGG